MTEKPFVSAIVAAAGNSSRMKGTDKLNFLLDGTPVIIHTLKKISSCDLIDEIVITANENNVETFRTLISEYAIKKVKAVICGGADRFGSVLNALSEISEKCNYVIIHDGARPCVRPEIINKSIVAAFEYGAAAVGVRVKDTIKEVSDGFILSTPQRSRLWAIHTPQVFEKNIYLSSVKKAGEYDFEITDDSMLVELTGKRVKIIEDDYMNIKITTPEDLISAQEYIKKSETKEND